LKIVDKLIVQNYFYIRIITAHPDNIFLR